jgi:hypothetical protein
MCLGYFHHSLFLIFFGPLISFVEQIIWEKTKMKMSSHA